jgi:hypothetical protein
VFESRVLRGKFGPKRSEERGKWSNYIMIINDINCSPNVVRVIKNEKKVGRGM